MLFTIIRKSICIFRIIDTSHSDDREKLVIKNDTSNVHNNVNLCHIVYIVAETLMGSI